MKIKETENQKYDVCVVGGGPSGVCAAISAARQGVKTILVEQGGLLRWYGNLRAGRSVYDLLRCRRGKYDYPRTF